MAHKIIITIPPGATAWLNFLNIDPVIPINGAIITFTNLQTPGTANFELRSTNNISASVTSGDIAKFEIDINIQNGDNNISFTGGANTIGVTLKIDTDQEIELPIIAGPPSLVGRAPIIVRIND
ncbi:MAG: hypothetical protein IT271_04250 [Chitinophagales bacterium]|nr:hypothetical protein [Chitinophagales bacterium]